MKPGHNSRNLNPDRVIDSCDSSSSFKLSDAVLVLQVLHFDRILHYEIRNPRLGLGQLHRQSIHFSFVSRLVFRLPWLSLGLTVRVSQSCVEVCSSCVPVSCHGVGIALGFQLLLFTILDSQLDFGVDQDSLRFLVRIPSTYSLRSSPLEL